MSEQPDIVKVESWVLCLVDCDSDEPIFYYNHDKDSFQRKFNHQCAFWSEKNCLDKEKQMNLEGIKVFKGNIDVKKEHLINSILKMFEEAGLIKL